MDLPIETVTWSASDLSFFGYNERKAVVLRYLEGEEVCVDPSFVALAETDLSQPTSQELYTKEDWERWFSSSQSSSPDWEDLKPGIHIVLCSRAPPDSETPGRVQYLPFMKNTWERLTREFHVSRNVKRTIARLVPCFSSAREDDATSGHLKMSFSARMSASLPDDLAMSTTYIPSTGSTFAVVYGCNDDQMESIEAKVRRAGKQAFHPLLVPGIFAELERTRLVNAVEDLLDPFTLQTEKLEGQPWSPDADTEGAKAQQHLTLCVKSQSLMDQIRMVKRQLSKFSKEIDVVKTELEPLDGAEYIYSNELRAAEVAKVGIKMKRRVDDIMIEYDDKIDECNMMICNTSLAMQTVWNHIARQDSKTNTKISKANAAIAVQTKVESAQMRTIALLTMIYLPLSSVAAIFSMDMFNWEAVDGQSIVSKHIWLFAVLTVGLTLLTIAAWFLGTRREKAMADKSDNYFNAPQRHDTFEYV
ncbi:hypothetical protein CSAL01_10275 [Colletotrichum salicis]|uniref:CorA-like Mg2+ transporter n=1 Tax=Colletotrichum salicis TaxID=1209931 RepID=A0A135U0F8_9PEZI|nr:hypothetical protein CSAL01_10275 [Colletotrichum salicis]